MAAAIIRLVPGVAKLSSGLAVPYCRNRTIKSPSW